MNDSMRQHFLLDDSKRQHFLLDDEMIHDTAESVLSRGTKRRREIEDDLREERQLFSTVLRIRIRMFLGLLDPDPLVRGMVPDPDPSIIKQK